MRNQINQVPTRATVDFDRIYRYTNAEALSFLNRPLGQRDLKEKTIASVTKAIKNNTTETIAPIMVDFRNMNLYDGQNRLEAFKRAWAKGLTPVLKVIYTPYGTEQMIDIQNQYNWQQRDKINYFIAHGDETVKRLVDFGLSHKITRSGKGISISYTSAMLTDSRVELNEEKETGRISTTITEEDFKLGEQVVKEVEMFFDIMNSKDPVTGKDTVRRNNWVEAMAQEWRKLRKEKGVYSQMVDLIGFNSLCKEGKTIIKGWQCSPAHGYWESAFKNVIDVVYRAAVAA